MDMTAKLAALGARRSGSGPARAVWLGIASPQLAEMAALAGAEFGVIDTEHGQIGPETMAEMVRALEAGGARAMVRVGEISPAAIKHALDAGAIGVIVPYVESAAEARAAVEAFHFRPLGKRGAAVRVIRSARYGGDADYAGRWNDAGVLVCQIESRAGLAAAGEIAALEGVDMLLLGPSDYCADAGLDIGAERDAVRAVFDEVAAAARGPGKGVMGFPFPGMDPAALGQAGCEVVVVGSDVAALTDALAAAVGALEGG